MKIKAKTNFPKYEEGASKTKENQREKHDEYDPREPAQLRVPYRCCN